MESNRLIAEFMGLKEHKGSYYLPLYNGGDWVPDVELDYYTSWDWLMPTIKECYESETEIEVGDITHGLLDCDLESTYQAVVNFIKQTTL